MLSYDQAAAKKQWREAVRAIAEAIEDAGGVVNNVNDARLDAVEEWIGESRRWLLDGLRLGPGFRICFFARRLIAITESSPRCPIETAITCTRLKVLSKNTNAS